MKGCVSTVGLGIDIGLVCASQQLDHVQVPMFGRPVQPGVATGEVFVTRQLGVLHQHLCCHLIVSLAGVDHPLFDGWINGGDGGRVSRVIRIIPVAHSPHSHINSSGIPSFDSRWQSRRSTC